MKYEKESLERIFNKRQRFHGENIALGFVQFFRERLFAGELNLRQRTLGQQPSESVQEQQLQEAAQPCYNRVKSSRSANCF